MVTISWELFSIVSALAGVMGCFLAYRQLFPRQDSPMPLVEIAGAWWYENAEHWYVIRLKFTNMDVAPLKLEGARLMLPVGGKIISESRIPMGGQSYNPGPPLLGEIKADDLSNYTAMRSLLGPKGKSGSILVGGDSDAAFEVLWVQLPLAQSRRERVSIDLIFRSSDVNAKARSTPLNIDVKPRTPIVKN